MILEALNTKHMICDPKADDVLKQFSKITKCKDVRIARYILLMYDPKSPLVELVNDYWSRKYEALEASGYLKKKGRYDIEVEDFVLGKNPEVNDMIVDWLIHVAKPTWTHLIFLNDSLLKYTKQAQEDRVTPNDVKAVGEITREMKRVVDEWMFGSETNDFLDKLYYRSHQELLKIRPEAYAKRVSKGETLDEDSPYDGYKVGKIKFVGNKVPDGKK